MSIKRVDRKNVRLTNHLILTYIEKIIHFQSFRGQYISLLSLKPGLCPGFNDNNDGLIGGYRWKSLLIE